MPELEIMPGKFDQTRARALYEQKLKPTLLRHQPFLSYDERNEFYVRLLGAQGLLQAGKHVVDLGAGLSVFGALCRAHGMNVTLVDDFGGGGGIALGPKVAEIPLVTAFAEDFGMKVVWADFLEKPLPLTDASVDVVTCFHSLEHWHHSPRRLFREVSRVLRPNGFFVLATPNAANIRKRLYVLFGRNIAAPLREWYEDGDPIFRGHVREPVVADLHQLLKWNGFRVVATHGRNFIGRQSEALAFLPKKVLDVIGGGSQQVLQFFPTFCSDIHVVGQKVE